MLTAQIATIPQRVESLKRTVDSLYEQIDHFYIMLNGHAGIPILKDAENKINFVMLKNQWGDGAKLYDAEKRSGYVFLCDDDLIYPPTYTLDMINAYNRHKGSIISLHGKVFHRPILRSHRGYKEVYHCLSDVVGDHVVEVGGTGVMMYNTEDVTFSIRDIIKKNMCDIWVARAASMNKIPIYVASHKRDYLQYIPQTNTIWKSHTQADDRYETKILNAFLK